MTAKFANLVQETTATTGTGTVTLAAMTGFARFSDRFATGDLVYYMIEDGANWEIGIGTVGASNTLARTVVSETMVAGTFSNSSPSAITLAGPTVVRCVMSQQAVSQQGARRNLVINGAMNIAQVNPATALTTTYPTNMSSLSLDCWYTRQLTSALGVQQQIANSLVGHPFSQRVGRTATSTQTGIIELAQAAESAPSRQFAGRVCTFSFRAIAGANFSAASLGLSARAYYGTGTDQSTTALSGATWTGQTALVNQTATLSTSVWKRFEYTFLVPTSATQIGFYFNYTPVGTAGANDWFEITDVRFEEGVGASDGPPEEYDAALQRVQRFSTVLDNDTLTFMESYSEALSYMPSFSLRFPTEMRATPSMVRSSNSYSGCALAAEYLTKRGVTIVCSKDGTTGTAFFYPGIIYLSALL
jgi:hypothetical protein